jgi:hypothetical protein
MAESTQTEKMKWGYGHDYTRLEALSAIVLLKLMGVKVEKIDFSSIPELDKIKDKNYSLKVKDGEYISFLKKDGEDKNEKFTVLFTSGRLTTVDKKDFDKSKQKQNG